MLNKIKILIVGNSGREHAIGWKILQSKRCGEIYFAPGNAGTRNIGINIDIKTNEISELLKFVENQKIDLTIALSENSLRSGIVDDFNNKGHRIFGPTSAANLIESSRIFSKNFMRRNNIKTPNFETFSDIKDAENYIRTKDFPLVIKTDYKIQGKGIYICEKLSDAIFALENILLKKKYALSGNQVVIEEFRENLEVSIHAFSDGDNYSIFPISKNYRKLNDGNKGENTSGMGVVCPVDISSYNASTDLKSKNISYILEKMKEDKRKFSGVIATSIALSKNDTEVLGYSATFGDPETQNFVRLLNADLLDVIDACINGNLGDIEINWWSKLFACTVIIASEGYPNSYDIDKIINGINRAEENEDVVVFHSRTKMKDGNLVTNGGRVLGVSATGETLEEAISTAYEAVGKISFDGMYYRKDIGS